MSRRELVQHYLDALGCRPRRFRALQTYRELRVDMEDQPARHIPRLLTGLTVTYPDGGTRRYLQDARFPSQHLAHGPDHWRNR